MEAFPYPCPCLPAGRSAAAEVLEVIMFFLPVAFHFSKIIMLKFAAVFLQGKSVLLVQQLL
jgi:hypothetical protein